MDEGEGGGYWDNETFVRGCGKIRICEEVGEEGLLGLRVGTGNVWGEEDCEWGLGDKSWREGGCGIRRRRCEERSLLYWKNDTQSMSGLNWVLDVGLTLQRPIGSICCIKLFKERKMLSASCGVGNTGFVTRLHIVTPPM